MSTRVETESINSVKAPEKASEESPLFSQQKGKELADIFDQEKHVLMQKTQSEEIKGTSFLAKVAQMMPWNWRQTDSKTLNVMNSQEIKGEGITPTGRSASMQTDHQITGSLTREKPTVIDPIPALEHPDALEDKQMQAILDSPEPLAPKPLRSKKTPSPIQPPGPMATKEEIEAYILSIKDLMGQVLYLLRGQIDLEADKAELCQAALIQLQEKRKVLDQLLDRLQEDLKHEQDVGNYFGYAQTAASLLAGFCTILSFVPKFGQLVAAPLGIVAAISNAIATAGKTYYGAQAQQHNIEITEINHQQDRYRQSMRNRYDDVSEALKISSQMRELLIEISKFNHKISTMLVQRV